MGGSTSGKGVSSSSSREPSAVPKQSPSGAGETNENVMTQDQVNSTLHNHSKPVTKHFMSPTISAASKTAIREKNILGERNETDSSYNPIQKSQSHVAKYNPSNSSSQYSHRSSSAISCQSCAFGSNDDKQKYSFVADSSLNQYDPLTNYLSLRPKYLRYKPNRRREIFLHLENKGEGNDGLGVERTSIESKAFIDDEGSMGHAKDSSLPPQESNAQPENDEILKKEDGDSDSPLPSKEGNVQPENDEIPENEDGDDCNSEVVDSEEDEDEEEECSDDNGWSFNWLSKFLFLMVVVLLSPLFASLMDYPLSSPTEPAMNIFDDIYHVFGVVSLDMNRSISDSQNKIGVSPSSFWELDQGEVGIELDEVELTEDEQEIFTGTSNELVEVAAPENGLSEGSDQELEKETTETNMIDDSEVEAFDQLSISEAKNKFHCVGEMEKEGFGQLKLHKALDKTYSCKEHQTLEIFERLAIPNASENDNYATVIQEFDQMKDEYEVVLVEPTSKASLREELLETQMEIDGDTYADIDDEIIVTGRMAVYSKESDTTNSDGVVKSICSELLQIGLSPAAALAIVSILSLISTYAISIYSVRQARTSREHSKPVVEPLQKSTRDEIVTTVTPNVEIEHVEHADGKNESIAKVSSLFSPTEEASKDQRYTSKLFPALENFSRVEMGTQDTKQLPSLYSAEASSLLHSVKDSSEELSHTKTLEVELLGELVIGEVSSSLKTCVRKPRLPETEESSYSFSQVRGSRLHPTQPSAFLECPASDPPYGITTENKLFKKERGKDGEAKQAITTPVRRSSRIRNRTVMSP